MTSKDPRDAISSTIHLPDGHTIGILYSPILHELTVLWGGIDPDPNLERILYQAQIDPDTGDEISRDCPDSGTTDEKEKE